MTLYRVDFKNRKLMSKTDVSLNTILDIWRSKNDNSIESLREALDICMQMRNQGYEENYVYLLECEFLDKIENNLREIG